MSNIIYHIVYTNAVQHYEIEIVDVPVLYKIMIKVDSYIPTKVDNFHILSIWIKDIQAWKLDNKNNKAFRKWQHPSAHLSENRQPISGPIG